MLELTYLSIGVLIFGKFQNLAVKFVKGLTKNSNRKLKVEIQFYVDSENCIKNNETY